MSSIAAFVARLHSNLSWVVRCNKNFYKMYQFCSKLANLYVFVVRIKIYLHYYNTLLFANSSFSKLIFLTTSAFLIRTRVGLYLIRYPVCYLFTLRNLFEYFSIWNFLFRYCPQIFLRVHLACINGSPSVIFSLSLHGLFKLYMLPIG